MAEEFQESLSSFNLWSSSSRCSDFFSCSTAANAGDIEETFRRFPANTENLTQPSSLDLLSSSFDWPPLFLESSMTNFQAVVLEDEARQGKTQMDYTETTQDSSMDMICSGFFQSENTISESVMDEIQILPTVKSSTASDIGCLGAKSNTIASRDVILPPAKKIRIETPSLLPTFKVRKEKLGDRITALQQLVSPFGKTDTASVLHEAIECIKFLHEEVNGLSNPYLLNGHQRSSQQILERQTKKDLRSRGLCLAPISSTFEVAWNELPPVDFWTQLWNMENYYSIKRDR